MRTEHIGKTFGLLVAIQSLPDRKCVCLCACGAEVVMRSDHVISGLSKSCGCAKGKFISEGKSIHGEGRRQSKSPEFNTWASIRARCADIDDMFYGGRGIRVDPRWNEFSVFLRDMGRRPSPLHQIDRIDNDGNYSPENCRWSTRSEQCRNRRSSRFIAVGGRRLTLAGWAEVTGIRAATIAARLKRGWSGERAVS